MPHLFTLAILLITTLSSFNTITVSDFDSFSFFNDHNSSYPMPTVYISSAPDSTSQHTSYSYDYTNDNTYYSPYTNATESSYGDTFPHTDTSSTEASSGESSYQSTPDPQSDSYSQESHYSTNDNWNEYSARDYDPNYGSSPNDHSNDYDSYAYCSPNNSPNYTHSSPSAAAPEVKEQSRTTTSTQVSIQQNIQDSASQHIQDSASYLKDYANTYRQKANGTCNKREAARWKTRIQAINASENNNYKLTSQSYSLSGQATDLLHTSSIDISIFMRCDGTVIQQCIQQEIITLVNQTAAICYKIKHQSINLFSKTITNLAHATIEYNQADYIKEALTVADCCWGLFDCALGAFEGAYDATYELGIPLEIY